MSPLNLPNVVFIVADQMKWSALRAYSEIGIETPSLEKLAQQGVRFENGVTPHPLCVPARVSMMTSRYAHSTGARRNETLMLPGELHAFRIWKELGYTTGLIGKNHCFIQRSDLALLDVRCEMSHTGLPRDNYLGEVPGNQGMEWVVPESVINESHRTRRSMSGGSGAAGFKISDHPIEGYSSRAITIQVEAFLERAVKGDTFDGRGTYGKQERPFALLVSYPDPHAPTEVHRKYAEMVPPKSVNFAPLRDGEFEGPSSPERNRVLYEMINLASSSEEQVRGVVSTYLAMTRFVDDGVGRIIDKLESLGIRDDTIVVFTADHGDFAGEHNMFGKGGVFYDCLVRVPLIVSYPGGPVLQGAVDDSPVSTIDILPTILQLSGIVDFQSAPTRQNGQNLAPSGPRLKAPNCSGLLSPEKLRRLQGRPLPTVVAGAPSRLAAYSEYGAGGPPFTWEMLHELREPSGSHAVMGSLWAREAEGRRKMVRTRRWKYITDLPHEGSPGGYSAAQPQDELYDLESDPWELTNVVRESANAGVISEMRMLLARWMLETEDYNPVPLPTTIGRGPKPEIDTSH